MNQAVHTGAEDVRWNLSFLYSGIDDPEIDRDVERYVAMAKAFHAAHKGRLHETLGRALDEYADIQMLGNRLGYYFFFLLTLDTNNGSAKAKKTEAERLMNVALGDYLEFFHIEIASIDDAALAVILEKNPVAVRYRPWIEKVRMFKPHQLTEEVESALTKRAEFGSYAWSEFYEEFASDLRFTHRGEEKNLEEMFHVLETSRDANERAVAMQTINSGMKGYFAKYAAQTLNIVIGEKAVEDRERKYKHPMEWRNKGARIPDAVVEALHDAVMRQKDLVRRYYRLKTGCLGLDKLRWSDRNAPMPFADTAVMPWSEAIALVIRAYESFSPTLAQLIRMFVANKWIDASKGPGKRGGAYNASCCLPGETPMALTMLNYLGSNRDVATVAHELGHGVHGMLAGEAQGALMMGPPMAYAETASVFGEMVTFNFLKKRLTEQGDDKQVLALVMGKLDDMINTVVRQIGFSNFERRIHAFDPATMSRGQTKYLSVAEFCRMWLETRAEIYGESGDVFVYGDDDYLWAYISHFHDPFYVYAYAFGELLTHSLYAKKDTFGERFEPLYLDLLRSGGTQNVVDLLKPFGLDPTNPQFWEDGINVSIGAMLDEAEKFSAAMGVKSAGPPDPCPQRAGRSASRTERSFLE